jgi:hypothetical protein
VISADGMTAAVGNDADNGNAGAAWIFVAPPGEILAPTPPLVTTATATSGTRIDVNWMAAAGATSYRVERRSAGTGYSLIGTVSGTTFADTTVVPGAAYQYRVKALNAAGESVGASDVATTITFDDDPLVPGTVVRAAHLAQLRSAVNAVRALAGLPAAAFSDPAAVGVTIRAQHIAELRTGVDAARTALGLATAPYGDPTLVGGAIRAVHFQELRERVR